VFTFETLAPQDFPPVRVNKEESAVALRRLLREKSLIPVSPLDCFAQLAEISNKRLRSNTNYWLKLA